MSRRFTVLLGGLILACAPFAALDASELSSATDLRSDALLAARQGGPLVVLYTRSDCKFCQSVKRDFLLPLAHDPRFSGQVVVREISQDSDAALRDFAGQATTQARLAAAEKIKLVPVVAFYGPGGRKLAEPIVGARLPDFYQTYLENALAQSRQALSKP